MWRIRVRDRFRLRTCFADSAVLPLRPGGALRRPAARSGELVSSGAAATPGLSGLRKSLCLPRARRFSGRQALGRLLFALPKEQSSVYSPPQRHREPGALVLREKGASRETAAGRPSRRSGWRSLTRLECPGARQPRRRSDIARWAASGPICAAAHCLVRALERARERRAFAA
jgi:hypothetical protein